MSKTVMCKGCGAEIPKKIKKCPNCGKRCKKPVGLIILAIIVLLIIISSISNSIEEAKEKKEKYVWPSTGIATLLPQPESEYGKINSESSTYFSINLFNISVDEYNTYVDKCKEYGFMVDYYSTSSSYYADDEKGNRISLYFYDKKKEMSIDISAHQEEKEKEDISEENANTINTDDIIVEETESEENNENVEDIKNEESETEEKKDVSSSNDTEFREWVDSYEDFMDEYVDFMKKYNESENADFTLLLEYAAIMEKYEKFLKETEEINEDELSVEDYKYYLDAQMRITKRLSEL